MPSHSQPCSLPTSGSYASLYQKPRTADQQAAFGRGIGVMGVRRKDGSRPPSSPLPGPSLPTASLLVASGSLRLAFLASARSLTAYLIPPSSPQDLYASAVGITVLQSTEIFPRDQAHDGVLCLFGLDADEATVRAALGIFGAIAGCELRKDPPVVRFASHEVARTVRRKAEEATASCKTDEESNAALAAALGLHCAGVDTLYNERFYAGRQGEEGRDDDTGRGW